MKRRLALLLCCTVLFGLLCGCVVQKTEADPTPELVSTEKTPETLSLHFAESYDDVFSALKDARTSMDSMSVYNGKASAAEEAVASIATGAGDADYAETYYSSTNVQVAGVDEGDIVKSDGSYFYILRDVELIIMKADGNSVSDVSHTIVGQQWEYNEDDVSSEKGPISLYIAGDRAVVLSSYYSWTYNSDSVSGRGENYTVVDIYDISDRSAPKLVKSLGQDGYVVDSRLIDSALYLCTAYYVDEPIDGDADTFVPRLYTDGKGQPVVCSSIGLLPHEESMTYSVLTSYDVDAASVISNLSILGGGETMYMNKDNLYLCRSVYGDSASEPTTDGPYEVTTHLTDVTTTVNRFSISDGVISHGAIGSVPGDLNNQFSMDEYNGYLRMATTEQNGGYRLYIDEGHKFENYEQMDSSRHNDVFVLDSDLKIVGSVTDIAPEESVFSARFNGDFAYLCTFKTVDPIFAVDLTNPTQPVVAGEVSLSGYSDYLHIWSDSQLFGLGMQTQEIESESGITARVDGMKMVMINVEDPAALNEEHVLEIDADYSQALYNHKAILVDSGRNLIAFPAEGNYLVYGYSTEQGFELKKEITFQGEWDWQSRGFYIGDYFYVIGSDTVQIVDLNTLDIAGQSVISRG